VIEVSTKSRSAPQVSVGRRYGEGLIATGVFRCSLTLEGRGVPPLSLASNLVFLGGHVAVESMGKVVFPRCGNSKEIVAFLCKAEFWKIRLNRDFGTV
jgi:hypothetical protein